jgi:hypothetical protein
MPLSICGRRARAREGASRPAPALACSRRRRKAPPSPSFQARRAIPPDGRPSSLAASASMRHAGRLAQASSGTHSHRIGCYGCRSRISSSELRTCTNLFLAFEPFFHRQGPDRACWVRLRAGFRSVPDRDPAWRGLTKQLSRAPSWHPAEPGTLLRRRRARTVTDELRSGPARRAGSVLLVERPGSAQVRAADRRGRTRPGTSATRQGHGWGGWGASQGVGSHQARNAGRPRRRHGRPRVRISSLSTSTTTTVCSASSKGTLRGGAPVPSSGVSHTGTRRPDTPGADIHPLTISIPIARPSTEVAAKSNRTCNGASLVTVPVPPVNTGSVSS